MEGKGNQQNQIHIVVESSSSSSMTNGVLPKRQRIRLDSNSNTKNNNTRTMEEPSSVDKSRTQQQRKANYKQSEQRIYRRGQKPKILSNVQFGNFVVAGTSYQKSHMANSLELEKPVNIQTRSAALSDIPGYSYDPVTKKYYKILENIPGQPAASTLHHLNQLAVRESAINAHKKFRIPSCKNNLPHLLHNFQVSSGGIGQKRQTMRSLEEDRLCSIRQKPSYSFEVIDNWNQRFDSCQYMDVSEDGKTLLGCWSVERQDSFSTECSRVLSFNVTIDRNIARKNSQLLDENSQLLYDTNGRYSCNTFGLQFEPLDNGICLETGNKVLVDMVLAPADRDVTCLLFATASSFYKSNGDGCPKITTKCIINLRPIDFNLTEEGRESMSSPIYNAQWTSTEPIWSLCFNSHHMKICVGMEKYARIFMVLSGQNFYVSSGGKNVISSIFSKDGNSLYLGRKSANISMLDLRLHSNHSIGEMPNSQSAGFIHLLKERPNTLLSETFDGKIKLWDIRMRRPFCEMQSGHRNTSHKLPCFVDNNENFIFVVGEDAIIRGWSLHTGKLLCSVNSPTEHIHQKASANGRWLERDSEIGTDFPRMAYSSSWGGRVGNSALVLAVNGELLVHELTI